MVGRILGARGERRRRGSRSTFCIWRSLWSLGMGWMVFSLQASIAFQVGFFRSIELVCHGGVFEWYHVMTLRCFKLAKFGKEQRKIFAKHNEQGR
jgi:hypothetical protein